MFSLRPHLTSFFFFFCLSGASEFGKIKRTLQACHRQEREKKTALCHLHRLFSPHRCKSCQRIQEVSPTTFTGPVFMVLAAQKALIRGNGSLGRRLQDDLIHQASQIVPLMRPANYVDPAPCKTPRRRAVRKTHWDGHLGVSRLKQRPHYRSSCQTTTSS